MVRAWASAAALLAKEATEARMACRTEPTRRIFRNQTSAEDELAPRCPLSGILGRRSPHYRDDTGEAALRARGLGFMCRCSLKHLRLRWRAGYAACLS